jgi:hypothetical protein
VVLAGTNFIHAVPKIERSVNGAFCIKGVLKATTILGCDNVNFFFFQAVFWKLFESPFGRKRGSIANIGYDIKFPQEFALFSPQSSSTYDNKDDLNNEPSMGETPNISTTNEI